MTALLLRCAGPMQSWGIQSRFDIRDTGREPSKSGIIGLVCAALGRPRSAPIADLAGLRMGVRVEKEGRVAQDYHTVGGGYRTARPPIQAPLKATGQPNYNAVVSRRYYLADADFIVGLAGDAALLQQVQDALTNPQWPLCLGRRAFPPSEPVCTEEGLQPGRTLEEALRDPPVTMVKSAPGQTRRLMLEDPAGDIVRYDQPISFADRTFRARYLVAAQVTVGPAPEGE